MTPKNGVDSNIDKDNDMTHILKFKISAEIPVSANEVLAEPGDTISHELHCKIAPILRAVGGEKIISSGSVGPVDNNSEHEKETI